MAMDKTLLGQVTVYPDQYDASLLQPIPRQLGRSAIGLDVHGPLPFRGVDIWTHYEVSWLLPGGKPVVAMARISVPADSPNIIESKSLKLYFNSLNFITCAEPAQFHARVVEDLSRVAGAPVDVELMPADVEGGGWMIKALPGDNLDLLPLTTSTYEPDPGLLHCDPDQVVEAQWHSHLLRSNCPVTDQPDWGTVYFHYVGPRIEPASLLAYVVSYRRHSDFHEQCIERMFHDLSEYAGAQQLTVYARYTRRGGLDINPWRSNFEQPFLLDRYDWRTPRQ